MDQLVMERFSTTHGFDQRAGEVRIRFDAPPELRSAIVDIAVESGALGLGKSVCRALRVRADGMHHSHQDLVKLLDTREWFEVYDVVEAIATDLSKTDAEFQLHTSRTFHDRINDYFERSGIGWCLQDGKIETRGDLDFEAAQRSCDAALTAAGLGTSRGELREARQDLSRRPTPDVTGAVQHAVAALECVLREVTGDQKATLGTMVANSRGRFTAPLDQVIEKLWGFASEYGRHLRENRTPTFVEAEFVVHVAAALIGLVLDQDANKRSAPDETV